jgi:hypothetical protein
MAFDKEKIKLENLLTRITGIRTYNDTNFEILNMAYKEYAALIRYLYGKRANIFGNLFNYELPGIKKNKKIVKESLAEETREQNLVLYRDAIIVAAERTVDYINNYIQ